MTKKKKTFRKFINEQVLGVKQKEKQFDKFEDFVKDVKGIKPPENKAASFQEFINEARGYEFDNDSVDKFDKMVIESKIEREQQKLEERKTRIDPNPIVLTNRQIEEMNRRRIIDEINEVLKHRDPVLDKMSFQQWLNIPHNKFVFELDEYQAKRLYEQDMSRVEKYEELKKKSGGGKIKVTTTAEEPFTPADLVIGANDYWWNPDSLSGSYSDGDFVSSFPSSGGSLVLTQPTFNLRQKYVHNHTWSAGKVASGVGYPPGTHSNTTDYFNGTVIPLSSSSGNVEGLTVAFVAKHVATDGHRPESYAINFDINGFYIQYRAYPDTFYGWRSNGTGYHAPGDWETFGSIRTVFLTISNSTDLRLVIPGAPIDVTSTITPKAISTAVSMVYSNWSTRPVLFGEMMILNYAITDQERADLQSYWADKYGA